MQIYRFGGEKTLAELVRNAYQLERKGPTVTSLGKQVAAANPHLDLVGRSLANKIAIGTPINLPTVAGAQLSAAAAPVRQNSVEALPTDKLLGAVLMAVQTSDDSEVERLNEAAALIDSVIDQARDDADAAELANLRTSLENQASQREAGSNDVVATIEAARAALRRQQDLLNAAEFRP
jgi:hypothetical protein